MLTIRDGLSCKATAEEKKYYIRLFLFLSSFFFVIHTIIPFVFFSQIKVIDSEGSIVPVNTPGEICIRGYCVMLGYWEDKEQTDKTVSPAGWLHSG